MEETRKVIPIEEAREEVVKNPGVYVDSDSEERKTITLEEFEEIMTANDGKKFFSNSADYYGLSVDLLCGGIDFDKTEKGEYIEITLCGTGAAEVRIEPEIIDSIYLNEDGTIGIEFNICVPELEIKFQDGQPDSEEA